MVNVNVWCLRMNLKRSRRHMRDLAKFGDGNMSFLRWKKRQVMIIRLSSCFWFQMSLWWFPQPFHNYGKSLSLMGKLTIYKWAISHSYVTSYQRVSLMFLSKATSLHGVSHVQDGITHHCCCFVFPAESIRWNQPFQPFTKGLPRDIVIPIKTVGLSTHENP